MPGTGPIGYESVTVSTTAVGLTTPQSGMTPMAAFLTVDTDKIRYRVDGTAPTSTVGHEVAAGGSVELTGRGEVKNFKAIRSSNASADSTLRVTHFSYWTP